MPTKAVRSAQTKHVVRYPAIPLAKYAIVCYAHKRKSKNVQIDVRLFTSDTHKGFAIITQCRYAYRDATPDTSPGL